MKKRVISVMAILALMFGPICSQSVKAQIVIMEEEEEVEESERAEVEGDELELPQTPEQGITIDRYAPLGSGMLILGCLGGAYLLGRRRKSED